MFRSNTDMLLLTTRLRLDPDGKPHLPGGLDVWKNLFADHPQGKYDAKLTRAAPRGRIPTTCWRPSSACPARPLKMSR